MSIQNEDYELQQKSKDGVSVQATSKSDDNSVYNQTRTRKLFSFSQLFAFSLTYMALWEGMCTWVFSPSATAIDRTVF